MDGIVDMVVDGASRVLDEVERLVDDAGSFLASERGRQVRRGLAAGLIAAAPMVAALPPMRASKLLRLVGAGSATALVVKAAEAIRDWEPAPRESAPA